MDIDNILIDGLEYVNWNRDLFEKAHAGGLTAIHATLVYWEDTKESFEKIDYWDNLIQSNSDILTHVKKSEDIFSLIPFEIIPDRKLDKSSGFEYHDTGSGQLTFLSLDSP